MKAVAKGYIFLAAFFALLLGAASATEADSSTPQLSKTVFAGGCFWCVEADFEKVDGVKGAVSGYTGGHTTNPTYKEVSRETTGHVEAVEVTYDPEAVSYKELVDYFFRHVDPLDDGGQFCDRGSSYKTAIFVTSKQERIVAEAAKENAAKILGSTVVTPIRDLTVFWPAEEYHQDYYKKKSLQYRYYRSSCGRDRRIRMLWGEENK